MPSLSNFILKGISASLRTFSRADTEHKVSAKPQKITIQTAVLREQTALEIRIRDNGLGMTAEVKTRIFEHLFTTKKVGKGTGLGLAIARQIVAQTHHGSLEVQSQLGQGTEFCIRLPMV